MRKIKNPKKGIVGYNGKYKHCFRIEEGDDISAYTSQFK